MVAAVAAGSRGWCATGGGCAAGRQPAAAAAGRMQRAHAVSTAAHGCAAAAALTGHLQVDAAGHGAALVVHIEEGLNLRASGVSAAGQEWQGPGRLRDRVRPSPAALLRLATALLACRHTTHTACSHPRIRPAHLGTDVVVAPRLVARHLLSVAVHGVAHPGHHLARLQVTTVQGKLGA